jgi:hypothetical protein
MGGYDAPGDFRPLMDKDITLHSFYQVRPEYDAKIPGILDQATALITSGKLNVPVAANLPALGDQGCCRPRRTRRQGFVGRSRDLR